MELLNSRSRNHQFFGNGELGQARHGVDIESVPEALAIRFHSAQPDTEDLGNFLVAETFSNPDTFLPLTIAVAPRLRPFPILTN